jgi:hypothetical protein
VEVCFLYVNTSIFPVLFIEKATIFPLSCLHTFVKYQSSKYCRYILTQVCSIYYYANVLLLTIIALLVLKSGIPKLCFCFSISITQSFHLWPKPTYMHLYMGICMCVCMYTYICICIHINYIYAYTYSIFS